MMCANWFYHFGGDMQIRQELVAMETWGKWIQKMTILSQKQLEISRPKYSTEEFSTHMGTIFQKGYTSQL